MKPEEFKSFQLEKPEEHKWIIVTNNIDGKDARGEMSHVWLVNFYCVGSQTYEGLVAFDTGDRKIVGLTHWKYA